MERCCFPTASSGGVTRMAGDRVGDLPGSIITGCKHKPTFSLLSLSSYHPLVNENVENMAPHPIEAITSPSSWGMVRIFCPEW